MSFKVISAEEAASYIHHDDNVGFGGFTAAGTPKVVTRGNSKESTRRTRCRASFRNRRFYRSFNE